MKDNHLRMLLSAFFFSLSHSSAPFQQAHLRIPMLNPEYRRDVMRRGWPALVHSPTSFTMPTVSAPLVLGIRETGARHRELPPGAAQKQRRSSVPGLLLHRSLQQQQLRSRSPCVPRLFGVAARSRTRSHVYEGTSSVACAQQRQPA